MNCGCYLKVVLYDLMNVLNLDVNVLYISNMLYKIGNIEQIRIINYLVIVKCFKIKIACVKTLSFMQLKLK